MRRSLGSVHLAAPPQRSESAGAPQSLWTALLSALALSVLGASLAVPANAQGAKAWSLKTDKGFVDDVMAFDARDTRFAYVHTDAAQFLTLVVIKTDGWKKETAIKVEPANRVPKQLAFTADGTKLVLVWMDGDSGAHGATVYELATGKALKGAPTGTTAALAEHKGEQCVSVVTTRADARADARGNTSHTVTAFRTSDLKKLGTGAVVVAADQMLKQPTMRLLYFEPGHLYVVGQAKGRYDKKRDIRLPERAVRWSVLERKDVWSEEPKELIAWTQVINMRPNHPLQYRFLQVSDDLKTLQLVDRANALGQVELPVKWRLYEPKSLEQTESWDGKTLWFSMTVDPVNSDAVRRKKADKERVDVYRLDADGAKAVPLGQVLTSNRKFRWVAGTSHFAFLRKLKGFGRGGAELELYKVAP